MPPLRCVIVGSRVASYLPDFPPKPPEPGPAPPPPVAAAVRIYHARIKGETSGPVLDLPAAALAALGPADAALPAGTEFDLEVQPPPPAG